MDATPESPNDVETPFGDGPPGPLYDCLVISDLHLGSDMCQARLLEAFLLLFKF